MNEHNEKIEKLKEVIEPVIKDNFLELVDIEISKGPYIRVVIDKIKGKVNINDCSYISNIINNIPEIEDIVEGNYILEVSSPGINRPLKKIKDFIRFKGENVKIITKDKIEKNTVFIGKIKDIIDTKIILSMKNKDIKIDFDNIKKANLEIDVFK